MQPLETRERGKGSATIGQRAGGSLALIFQYSNRIDPGFFCGHLLTMEPM